MEKWIWVWVYLQTRLVPLLQQGQQMLQKSEMDQK